MTLLKIDIDGKVKWKRIRTALDILGLKVDFDASSICKTAHGFHLKLDVNRKLDDKDACFVQMAVGSDFKRECLNHRRITEGDANWNVLFSQKFKKGRMTSKEMPVDKKVIERNLKDDFIRLMLISDVSSWDGYDKAFMLFKPDITVLAGDVAVDGFTHTDNLKAHVSRFYDFIELASLTSKVLTIRGNHDAEYYDESKIRKLGGNDIDCRRYDVQGLSLFGIGFENIKDIKSTEKSDIIVTHCMEEYAKKMTAFEPKIILRGHSGIGIKKCEGVAIVSSGFNGFVILSIRKKEVIKAEFFKRDLFDSKGFKRLEKIGRNYR